MIISDLKIGDYVDYEYINNFYIPGRVLKIDEKSQKIKLEICIVDKEKDSKEKETIQCDLSKIRIKKIK